MKKLMAALGVGLLMAVTVVASASAFEFKPYDAAAVQKLIASGKPVVVHVFAPWCLQCRAQQSILNKLSSDASYDGVAFFRVAYDDQKEVVKALGVPRSTLIGYKGGQEVAEMSWGTNTKAVLSVLDAVR